MSTRGSRQLATVKLATYRMSQHGAFSSAAQPLFEVAFTNGKWWSMPADPSDFMYEKYRNEEDVGYVWDWGPSRYGSFELEGAQTTMSRYVIDTVTWTQKNTDTKRQRKVRLVWLHG